MCVKCPPTPTLIGVWGFIGGVWGRGPVWGMGVYLGWVGGVLVWGEGGLFSVCGKLEGGGGCGD